MSEESAVSAAAYDGESGAARQQSPEQFEEVFRESFENAAGGDCDLKGTLGRFSEFSKMPQPAIANRCS